MLYSTCIFDQMKWSWMSIERIKKWYPFFKLESYIYYHIVRSGTRMLNMLLRYQPCHMFKWNTFTFSEYIANLNQTTRIKSHLEPHELRVMFWKHRLLVNRMIEDAKYTGVIVPVMYEDCLIELRQAREDLRLIHNLAWSDQIFCFNVCLFFTYLET